eukprot:g41582.t1
MVGGVISRLKHKIHNTRFPLSSTGQKIAAFFYFMIPVTLGPLFMLNVIEPYAHKNWKERNERLDLPEDRKKYNIAEYSDMAGPRKKVQYGHRADPMTAEQFQALNAQLAAAGRADK